MMRLQAIVAQYADLAPAELESWIERRWIQPERATDGWVFHEVDIARIRLVYDLRRDLDVGEEILPMVLGLLDQIYELRSGLKAVSRAIAQQSPATRQAIAAALEASRD
ncbi:MAG TPA: chaperone modulator CbpM [Aliidongia sp.]|nr:chaperone modulator CbpM [Aliidongia sp.]